MKIVAWTIASLLATSIASSKDGLGVPAPENSPGAHFPSVKASNLEKRGFSLPADFEGDRNLLLVAFEREQQKDVDTWWRKMRRFEELDPGFHYYELPTIQRPNAFTRCSCPEVHGSSCSSRHGVEQEHTSRNDSDRVRTKSQTRPFDQNS